MNSLGVFLGQELVRFNGLIEVMKITLNDLQRAIKVRGGRNGSRKDEWNAYHRHGGVL